VTVNKALDLMRKIRIGVFGDTSKGSPGWRMQTFCEDTFEFKTLADPFATYQFKELPESPTMKIIPGKAAKVVCVHLRSDTIIIKIYVLENRYSGVDNYAYSYKLNRKK
jgi:hypothetical protein